MDGPGVLVFLRLLHCLGVIGPGRSGWEPDARHVRFPLRRFADIHTERDARPGQQFPHPGELVLGQCIHGVDNHSSDARRDLFVAEKEAPADDRVQEAFGFPRTGSRRDECGLPGENRPERLFLMPVEAGVRVDLGHQRMQQPFLNQLPDRHTFPEGPGQAEIGAAQQGCPARLVERQEPTHLGVQIGVGEGVGGHLVTQEVTDDGFCVERIS